MEAEYKTKCPICLESITPGTEIKRTEMGFAHVVCPEEKPTKFVGTSDEEMGF